MFDKKRSRRIIKDEAAIKRQVRIAKIHHGVHEPPHAFAKKHAMTCGNSKCVMCGNPRKFFSELTIQERSFEQTKKWD